MLPNADFEVARDSCVKSTGKTCQDVDVVGLALHFLMMPLANNCHPGSELANWKDLLLEVREVALRFQPLVEAQQLIVWHHGLAPSPSLIRSFHFLRPAVQFQIVWFPVKPFSAARPAKASLF